MKILCSVFAAALVCTLACLPFVLSTPKSKANELAHAYAKDSDSAVGSKDLPGSAQFNALRSLLSNNSLSFLMNLNQTDYVHNLTALASGIVANRTGRSGGWGGGGWGWGNNGIDPALLLLLKDDHHWGWGQGQGQSQGGSSSSMSDFGQLGLLTLLGLALISRMPTQG